MYIIRNLFQSKGKKKILLLWHHPTYKHIDNNFFLLFYWNKEWSLNIKQIIKQILCYASKLWSLNNGCVFEIAEWYIEVMVVQEKNSSLLPEKYEIHIQLIMHTANYVSANMGEIFLYVSDKSLTKVWTTSLSTEYRLLMLIQVFLLVYS